MRNNIIVLTLILCCTPAASAQEPLKSYQADYIIKYDGIPIGTSTTALKIQPKSHYQLCIDNVTTLPLIHGRVRECSNGNFAQAQVQPLFYEYQYQREKTRQTLTVAFNWQKHLAIIKSKGKTWQMPIPSNTQDKLSYQLALRLGLQHQQRQFSFPVADGGKIKFYRFQLTGAEKISTPMQTFATIRLERLPMPNKEHLILWIASAFHHIVVRVQQNKHLVDIGTAEITHFREG